MLMIFIIGSTITNTYAQEDPDSISYVENDSIIFESPVQINLESVSVVRFSTDARVYLRWTAPVVSATGYTVRYKLLGATGWTTGTHSTLEKIITSLQLDTSYVLEILPTGVADPSKYQESVVFSTYPQVEPIIVSHDLFNELTAWFSNESETRSFCEFMDDAPVDLFEKLAFLQRYVFNNEAFSDGGSSTNFLDWYPSTFSSFGGEICLPEWATECQCKVISSGSNFASPGKIDDVNGIINPKIVQKIARGGGNKRKTFVDRFEAGAARFIGLRQDASVGMEYEMSNLSGADDATAATSAASTIQFFLGCLDRDEGQGLNTNLPEECDCDRPLHISYQYSTSLIVKAEKKNCPWSMGAAAQAEDLAVVVVHDIKTGELTALDAGKYMVSRKCDSGWNPDWWIALLNIGGTVGEYYATSNGGSGNTNPTSGQIGNLIDGITTLIGTPFAIQSGVCGTTDGDQVLVHGNNTLSLLPNRPIRITLFSSYYAKVKGYGCWRAEAGIASDYYLLGVVESELTEDPECCADKFATYIVGSLGSESVPDPLNPSDVELDPVNTIENRLGSVANDLALYGSWYNHSINPLTGLIEDLVYEFNRLYGSSCSLEIPFQAPTINLLDASINTPVAPVKENMTIDLHAKEVSLGQISIFDFSGRLIRVIYSGQINVGINNLDLGIGYLANGSYILHFNIGGQLLNRLILIAN